MNCPKCGGKTYIIDTRASEKYKMPSLIRRRMCYRCKNRFSTYEVTVDFIERGERAKDMLKQIKEFVEGEKE